MADDGTKRLLLLHKKMLQMMVVFFPFVFVRSFSFPCPLCRRCAEGRLLCSWPMDESKRTENGACSHRYRPRLKMVRVVWLRFRQPEPN